MDTLNKQDYKDLVNSIDTENIVKATVIEFIDTYDGNNVKEFNALIYTMILLMMKHEELKIKAAGYDAILDSDKKSDGLLQEIKEDYDAINAGELPTEPPTGQAAIPQQ